ncbi:unnamed protein product [Vitrella brassicaformis CCMP3155]|uniref:Uncharacterized protein n=1 Tax=Vitrella brassicaformis (strain CCMP3155) TaxID=1169540 RepID=A0A0G4GA70_VITBC|nr:unnamed protein product [Vitrella brassicaformis CCMP3155]|eukprot:CEM25476.1 unnamed protein product [Vitrella brassicaformis CCMP3155]
MHWNSVLGLEVDEDGAAGEREHEHHHKSKNKTDRDSGHPDGWKRLFKEELKVKPINGTENVSPKPSPGPVAIINSLDLENSIRMFGILATPPDPVGAVGPKSILTATNTGLVLQEPKNGKLIAAERPREFFLPVTVGDGRKFPLDVPGELEEVAIFFSPVAQFDPNSGHFFVGYLFNQCEQVIAVSKTSEPKSFTPKDWLIARFPIDDREPSTIFEGALAAFDPPVNRTITGAILSQVLAEVFGLGPDSGECKPTFFLSHNSLGVSSTLVGFAYNAFASFDPSLLIGSRSIFFAFDNVESVEDFEAFFAPGEATPADILTPGITEPGPLELEDLFDASIEIVDSIGSLSLVPYVQAPEDEEVLLGPVGSDLFASFDTSADEEEDGGVSLLQQAASDLAGSFLYGFTNRGPAQHASERHLHTPRGLQPENFLNSSDIAREAAFRRIADPNETFGLEDSIATEFDAFDGLQTLFVLKQLLLTSLQSGIITLGRNTYFPSVEFDEPDEDMAGSQLGGFQINLGDDILQACRQTEKLIVCAWTGFRTIKDASLDKRCQQAFIAYAQLDVFTLFSRAFDALVPPPPQTSLTPIVVPSRLTRAILGWDFAFPSVAATPQGDVLVGFQAFDRAGFPSAAYVFKPADCPDFDLPVIYKAGEAPYFRPTQQEEKTDKPRVSSWGFGSSTVNDILDPQCLWTVQPYAKVPGPLTNGVLLPPGFGNWGLAWAKRQEAIRRRRRLKRAANQRNTDKAKGKKTNGEKTGSSRAAAAPAKKRKKVVKRSAGSVDHPPLDSDEWLAAQFARLLGGQNRRLGLQAVLGNKRAGQIEEFLQRRDM